MQCLRKIYRGLIGLITLVLVSFWWPLFEIDESGALSLSCTAIPTSAESICVLVTDSPNGPFDDVDIYHQTGKGRRILLSQNAGGVATFNGIGFSANGEYTWESWSEEGHPYYTFYRTAYYLVNGGQDESIQTLDDYYFDAVKAFTANGEFIYSHTNNDDPENCQDISSYISSKALTAKKKINTEPSPCYKVIVLKKDKA